MSEYNLDGIPDDDEYDSAPSPQYNMDGIPDDDDSPDVASNLQEKYRVTNQNPDLIATAKRNAEKSGLPMLVAQNQPEKAAKLAAAPDWTKLTKDAPVTSRALANDGTLFQIAHDDHEALGGIERGLLTLGKALPVAGPLVQAADTTRSLIEGMTGINIMGDKDDVGTVIQKYGENMDNQARKAGLGLFMAGDSALAHFLAPNAGEGTDGWYYRQNKGEIDAVVDRIATLDASDDPLQKNAALQLAQEYGFDSVPRTIGPGNVVNRRKLLDAVIDKRASAFQANTNAGIIDKNKRRDELVELVRNEDEVLKANAAKVDAYTVPWLVSNSLQFIQQIAQGAAASSVAGPFGAAVAFGAPVFGGEYATAKAAGKTDDNAALDAGASALIESATEMVGLKSVDEVAKGIVPILQGIGRATGTNFSQEQAAEIAGQVYNGFANQEFVEQPDYIKGLDAPEPVKQFLAILDQQLQSGVVGAAGGGGAAVAGAAVKPAADKYKKRKLAAYKAKVASTQRQIDAARTRSSQIIETIEKIRTSKLKARDTSSLKALIQSIGDAENDAPTAMLLSADAFKQGGIDTELFKRAVPSAADQVDRAIELGGTIAIDIGELANITDSEVEQGLIPHLKVREEEWTQYEAESAELWADEAMAEMQEAADEAAKQAEQQDEWTRQRQEIQTAYEDQLNKAGKYDKAANKKMAALVSAFYSTTASKLAKHDKTMTPIRLFNEAMMRVTGVKSGEGFNQNTGDNNSVDGEGNIYNQAAYHGSPYKFTKFTLEHMGKGEGAQAYGWGLYFAGNKDVAEYYRNTLSAKELEYSIAGKKFEDLPWLRNSGVELGWLKNWVLDNIAAGRAVAGDGTNDSATDKIFSLMSKAKREGNIKKASALERLLALVEAGKVQAEYRKGQLYKVEIPEDSEMLLWDKPLSEQPKKVREALEGAQWANNGIIGYWMDRSAENPAYNGDDLYQRLKGTLGSDEAASKYLNSLGIAGIKYLDGDSRNRPLREIKREFLAELPEDADFAEVEELIGTGTFSPANEAVIKALQADDWLGFDYPAQALSAALGDRLEGFDASQALKDAVEAAQDGSTYNYVIFDDAAINITETYYQDGPKQPRGAFDPNTLNITLLEGADLSTFLHESGHFFLEMYARYADQSAEIGADMDALLKWFGIEGDDPASRLAKWRSMPVKEQRQFHEQFAESFEQYLFTGKAPSIELQPIFSTYRRFLNSVYKSLARFVAGHSGAKLNPEIAAVMDRMLATQDQIDEMTQARDSRPLFANADQAGMTQAQWDAYMQDQVRSVEQAADTLVARSLRDMKWLTNAKNKQLRKLQREAQALRARVQMEARRAILSRPEYRAWLALKRPVEKLEKAKRKNSKELDASVDNLLAAIAKLGGLDMEEVVSSWGSDPADFNKKSGVFGKPVLRKKGGLSIETIAEKLLEEGYLTPDQHGKVDLAEFEEKLDRAARGEPMYSMFADYDLLLHGERQQMNVDRNNLDYIGVRLNRQDVVEMLEGMAATADSGNVSNGFFQDDDEGDSAPKQRSIERMLSDDGLHPDTVAELFGLSSGDELVRKLLEMDDPFTAIDKLTDKIMMERHSEFTDQKELERMAEAAIHNEARVRFVATELAMLNKAEGGQKDLKRIIDAARLYAMDLLAGQRIQDIRPSKHAADAARAGKESAREFAKGNLAATIMAKRNQVLHTELVRQAHAAKDEVDKGLKYFARIEKAVNNGVLDADYAQQIIGLLQQHDLRKSVSLIDLERRESLAAWAQAQQDAGFEPMIPENLLMEAAKTHYKRMTLDEFRELVDAIKNIEHLGRLKYKLVQNARKRELAAAAAEIGEAIADNATGEVQTRLEKNSVKDRIFDLANGFLYMHRKFASLIRQMDGWKDGGVLWDYFVKTMNDAGDREAVMREQATMAMADLMKPLHESGGFGMMPKKLFITQIGTSLTREGRLMVALNWGNEGNRQRLMDGEGWDVNQVNAVLATLNAEDWKFVQGVWDHLETYRPMVGEQQKRLSGVEPKWIEASPFMVAGKDGQTYELRGGYLPVKYDADRSTKSLTQEALNSIMDQHKAVRAKTRDSFTKGRAAKVVNRPLRKDFGVIFQHLTEVTHRLAWQDWLTDSKRLLAQPAVDEAIRQHYGPLMVEELQKTLDDIATGEVGPSNEFEAAINHLRTGTTVAGLGLNVMTSLMQPLGLTQSMVRIGPTWVMKGLAKWGRMEDALPWIYERSDLMRLRGKTFQREINEELNKIRSPKRAAFNELMFVLIQKGQIIADVLTWLGAYEKAIAEQGPNIDEKLAAKLADQAVLDAQSGGMQKDLARIQRGGSLQRLFTMFYSYFSSTYNLSVESVRKVNVKDPATVMSAAIDFLLLYSLPAAIGTAMKFALTGDDDEDEFWHRMALDQVSYFLAVMVGLREFGAVVSGFSGYSGPAGTRFFNEAAKLATQIGQGDMDAALLKALNNVGGILFHYPAGQINKTVQGASALLDDETDNPAALLFGHQK